MSSEKKSQSKNRLVVLASGRGSNFQAIAKAIINGQIPNITITLVVCNVPDAPVVSIARTLGIPIAVIPSKGVERRLYEEELLRVLLAEDPTWICLAGYMLILGKTITNTFANKIINIHPSLLPSFQGLRAQQQAIDAGVQWTGCTVHLVNDKLDDGPILLQNVIPILPEDTEQSLSERLIRVEHQSYVEVIRRLATELFTIKGQRIIWEKGSTR